MRKLMAPAGRRIANMLARAIITRVDDARLVQSLQLALLADETSDGVEHFQTYGLTSSPHPGAEALVAFVGGLRSHGVVVAVGDRRYRLRELPTGEVAVYDDLGQKVHLTRQGLVIETTLKIDVTASGDVSVTSQGTVSVTAPKVVVSSDDVNLGGEGGAAVARVGDPVVDGVIQAGSPKVKAT